MLTGRVIRRALASLKGGKYERYFKSDLDNRFSYNGVRMYGILYQIYLYAFYDGTRQTEYDTR